MITHYKNKDVDTVIEEHSQIAIQKFNQKSKILVGTFYKGKPLKIRDKYIWTSKKSAEDSLWTAIGKRICGKFEVQREEKPKFREEFMSRYEFRPIELKEKT